MAPAASGPSQRLAAAAQALAVDAVSGEVLGALGAAGIDVLLLKGPTFARLLYDSGGERSYSDTDLLLHERDVPRAESVIAELGFRLVLSGELFAEWQRHARTWQRPADAQMVDVHWTLPGLGVEPERAWAVLARDRVALAVGGAQTAALAPPAAALHVGLHAAQHGTSAAKGIRDLERALERLPTETWRGAAGLARELNAEAAFGAGLRLAPAGRALAGELTLGERISPALLLQAGAAPGAAMGFEHLAATRGTRARARLVARTLVPPADHLRFYKPLARRGRSGLAAAYLVRPLDLARQAPGALRAWRAARREARLHNNG